jgi:hypothetical protein
MNLLDTVFGIAQISFLKLLQSAITILTLSFLATVIGPNKFYLITRIANKHIEPTSMSFEV